MWFFEHFSFIMENPSAQVCKSDYKSKAQAKLARDFPDAWDLYRVALELTRSDDIASFQVLLPSIVMHNCNFGIWPQEKLVLHWAAKHNAKKVACHLISLGTPIDVPDLKGQTALHHAAFYGQLDFIRLLVDAGANKFAADNRRRETPRDAAVSGKKNFQTPADYAEAFQLLSPIPVLQLTLQSPYSCSN